VNHGTITGTLIGLWFNSCVALPATVAFAGAITIAAAIAPQQHGRIVD